MGRTLSVVAVGLIILEVVALVGPTFGFSTIASDRGVQVSTATGGDAYLGMVSEDVVIDNEDGSTIITLSNNLNSDMAITNMEVDISEDSGELNENPNLPSSIDRNGEETVDVACEEIDGSNSNNGGTATITVTIEQAAANGVTITDASIEDEFDYNCHPGGGGGQDGDEDDGPEDQPGGDITFETLTVTVTSTAGPNDMPTEVEFSYELSKQADVVFGIVGGDRANSETVNDTIEGTFPLDSGGRNPSGSSATVSGDIVGGEECSIEVEAGDEDISVCD